MFRVRSTHRLTLMVTCLAWIGALACSSRQGGIDPLDAMEATGEQPSQSMPGSLDGSGSNDVASGGQSGGASGGAPGPACYCQFGPLALARVVSPGDGGACAVFELVDLPDAAALDADNTYQGLSVGDHFGGNAQLLCGEPFSLEEGEPVFVEFQRGQRAGADCPEYRSCSSSQCGEMSDLEDVPVEEQEQALLDFGRCDSACLESTRTACQAHESGSQYSGTIVVARRNRHRQVVFVDGETYTAQPGELTDQDCHPDGVPERPISRDVVVGDGGNAAGEGAPPPAPAPSTVICPIP
jgi:hypothetical protein